MTHLADVHLAHLVGSLDTLVERLARSEGAEEATSKSIAGAVGVDDLVGRELGDGVRLGVGVREVLGRG